MISLDVFFRFDSILVRLKAACVRRFRVIQDGRFDSILVRLKGFHIRNTRIRPMFRFHTGSIKRFENGGVLDEKEFVSIPYWFD